MMQYQEMDESEESSDDYEYDSKNRSNKLMKQQVCSSSHRFYLLLADPER